jgi:hypothetical protein
MSLTPEEPRLIQALVAFGFPRSRPRNQAPKVTTSMRPMSFKAPRVRIVGNIRKPRVLGPLIDWGPWSVARFQTEQARDGFVFSVANAQDSGWRAEVMPDDGLGAHASWKPGRFLGLNDVAYAHGGRIVVARSKLAFANRRNLA